MHLAAILNRMDYIKGCSGFYIRSRSFSLQVFDLRAMMLKIGPDARSFKPEKTT